MGGQIRRLQFEPRALDDPAMMAVSEEKRLGPDLAGGNLADPEELKQGAPTHHPTTLGVIRAAWRGKADMTSFQAGDPAWCGAITVAPIYNAIGPE
jgi:hypothetical protein